MKRRLLTAALLFLCAFATQAQNAFIQKVPYRGAFAPAPASSWTTGWTNWDPQNTVYPVTNVTIDAAAGDTIKTNTTWTSNNVYLIKGVIYVKDGATLTIEAGTIIRGSDLVANSSIVVTRGSKIMAEGTASRPIIFTSNKPAGLRNYGNWGGLIILGKATNNIQAATTGNTATGIAGLMQIEGLPVTTINRHGAGDALAPTADDNDNSGVLKFVRVEFPGYVFSANNEINGITMGSVGRGTTIDYVQVAFSDDDAFEWFGGTVNASHLVAFSTRDDDFDTDYGYNGSNQFGLVVRDPNKADASRSNAFESDNEAGGNTRVPAYLPKTNPQYSNFTLIGPWRDGAVASGSIDINHNSAAELKRNTEIDIANSVFIGWNAGFHMQDAFTLARVQGAAAGSGVLGDSTLRLRYNIVAGTNAQPLNGSSKDYKNPFASPHAAYDSTGFKSPNTGNGIRYSSIFSAALDSDSSYFTPQKNENYFTRSGFLLAPTTTSFAAADYRPSSGSIVNGGSDYTAGAANATISSSNRLCDDFTPEVGAINGSATVAATGAAGLVYSVTPVAGVDTYVWAVPAGFTITAGQGTSSITVTIAAGKFGSITVVPGSFCTASGAYTYGNVSLLAVSACTMTAPAAPTPVFNYANLCSIMITPANLKFANSSNVARISVSAIPANTTAFEWTLPAGVVPLTDTSFKTGVTLVTNQSYIDVYVLNTTSLTALVSLRGKSPCNVFSAAKTAKVPFKTPVKAILKSWDGSADVAPVINVCPYFSDPSDLESDIVQYTVRQDSVTTGFTWTVSNPATMEIVGSANDTIVSVKFKNSFAFGVLTITKASGCGSAATTLTIKKLAPSKPGKLITKRNGTTPSPFINVCDVIGTTEFVRYQLPSTPAYATSFNWSVSNLATMQIVGGGSSSDNYVDVKFLNGFTFGNVVVTSQNACGVSAANTNVIKATIPVFPALTTINGVTSGGTLCGSNNIVLTTSAVATDSTTNDYIWVLPAGVTPNASIATTNLGSVTGGTKYSTASNSIAIDWGSGTKSGKITVAGRSNCGEGKAISLTLVATPAVPGTITASAVCPAPAIGGAEYDLTIDAVAGASGPTPYIWKAPTGLSIISGQGTTTVRVKVTGSPLTTATVSVASDNTCGTSLSKTISYETITAAPDCPGTVVGRMSENESTSVSIGTVKLIPNPNKGQFTLMIKSTNLVDKANIQVIDAFGRLISTRVIANSNGTILANIDDLNLVTGAYIVKYTIGTETGTVKMIVQK